MYKEWSKEVFASNLKYYMEKSGKTQKELAEIAGVSEPTFSYWINGIKFPRIDKIQKLADYFGILKSDLIEEHTTEEIEKASDIFMDIADWVADDLKYREIAKRARYDSAYYNFASAACRLTQEQLAVVEKMILSFLPTENHENDR